MIRNLVIESEAMRGVPANKHDEFLRGELAKAGFDSDAPVDCSTSADKKQLVFTQNTEAPAVRIAKLEKVLAQIARFDCVESHTRGDCGYCPSCLARGVLP